MNVRISERIQKSSVWKAAQLLPERQRRKLILLVLVQLFLGMLDLLAVALSGLLATLAIAGIQSSHVGSTGTISTVLRVLHLKSATVQWQVGVLAVLACAIFLGRTAASIYLIRRALHFLGVRSAEASADLIARLLAQPLTYLQKRSSQEFLFGVTSSANYLVLGVLGAVVVMAADLSMLVAMALLLLYASPLVALLAGVMLAGIVALLHRLTTAKAHLLGTQGAKFDVQSRDMFVEAVSTFRDMQVRGSRQYYAAAMREVRLRAAFVAAESTFLPNVSKYVLESSVILGAVVIGAAEFALQNAEKAVGTLALFLAAGTRLAPAIIRLQQGSIALRVNMGQGQPALALQAELGNADLKSELQTKFHSEHSGFEPTIVMQDVSYSYPTADQPAVAELNFRASAGQLIAFVGPSGAGKSTAADLLLGVLQPQDGTIEICGQPPVQAVERWPGAIAYVPQDVWIADGSIRKNVALGFEPDSVPDAAMWQALEIAHLDELVRNLPDGLDANVGERGARLSGGQRQRLGIARALVTNPSLIVLDEATSALDAETEHEISEALHRLRGHVTLVVIAHRLAIVREADTVLYFDDGHVLAQGTFDSVRESVPGFAHQARLLGL